MGIATSFLVIAIFFAAESFLVPPTSSFVTNKFPCQTHPYRHSYVPPARHESRLNTEKESGHENATRYQWKHEPFDFSSRFGWDKFYKKGIHEAVGSATNFSGHRINEKEGDSEIENDDQLKVMESLEYEWHSHIPHSAIVEAIKPAISASSAHYAQLEPMKSSVTAPNCNLPSVLVIGCGNSALPRILHDSFDVPIHVTCLDYSPVCIEMIQSLYGSKCRNMDFIVGDATRLKEVLAGRTQTQTLSSATETPIQNFNSKNFYDIVIDKGLLDALMCGEGFDSDVEKLMKGINDVLTPHNWGMHVLICFELSHASKRNLEDLGSLCHGRSSNGSDERKTQMFWEFDIPVEGSEHGRATFNIAKRLRPKKETSFEENSLEVDWN